MAGDGSYYGGAGGGGVNQSINLGNSLGNIKITKFQSFLDEHIALHKRVCYLINIKGIKLKS